MNFKLDLLISACWKSDGREYSGKSGCEFQNKRTGLDLLVIESIIPFGMQLYSSQQKSNSCDLNGICNDSG